MSAALYKVAAMTDADKRRATLFIMAVFFIEPLSLGGWLALIPYVKQSLDLSPGWLAVALMGSPLGLLPGLQVAGKISARIGPRRLLRLYLPLMAISALLMLLAWNVVTLFLALLIFGFLHAFPEVGINVYAGRLEKQAEITVMSRCHGFWAVGLMTGSGTVALLPMLAPLAVLALLIVVSAVGGFAVAQAMPRLSGDDATNIAPPQRRIRELPTVLAYIGAFMLFVTLTEGAMADWAAVHLAGQAGLLTAQAGIAVTIFSAFMAGGRFAGDWLKRRLGPVALARGLIASAIMGMLLLVLPLPTWCLYPGFALVGLGVSVAYPLGVSAVAALDDEYESANIALMATVALGAFLAGPPLIGGLAEGFSLSVGFAALIPPLVAAFFLARWLAPDESARKGPARGLSEASARNL